MVKLTPAIIEGFSTSCLLKNFDSAAPIPDCHREWWDLFCDDTKFVAIAAPRGHAKSTALTHTAVLAAVLFRNARFVVIFSDTETQAVQFLGDIKTELQANDSLAELFGTIKFIKYSETDIIVEMDDGHRFRIMAKGSGQSVRGMKWANKRPDLIMCDDMENDEIVLNQERREKFKRWFFGSLIPCLSPSGKLRMVGTILHMDSFLENLMPRYYDKYTVTTDLKIYSTATKRMWKSVKYKAHPSIHDFSSILWPERWSKDALQKLQKDYVDKGLSDVYSQELLNIPVDPSKAFFKKSYFLEMSEDEYSDIISGQKICTFYIGADLAISERERADFTVFVVMAKDIDNILYTVDVIRERMDARGIVDTIFRLHQRWKPEFFAIEEEKITKAIGPFLREEMLKRDLYPQFVQLRPIIDKESRASSIQARMTIGAVKFHKNSDWYNVYEDELMGFPRAVKNDQVDATANIGLALDKFVETPTRRQLEDEEWEDEYNNTYANFESYAVDRSSITGY